MNTSKEYKGTCTECGEENYFLCEECNEYWSYDYVEFFHLKDGRTVCEYCIEDFDESEIESDYRKGANHEL